MKRIIALVLAMTLLLSGCGTKGASQETTQPIPETTEDLLAALIERPAEEETTEATTEPTTEPTEPPKIPFDPLNGEILDAPFDGRIYMVSVANTNDASIPHVNLRKADVVMEMFVNGSVVRLLALFSDLSDVEAIGSVRSTRMMFNDICQHYNGVLAHAGGDGRVLRDASARGIVNYNIDSLMRYADELRAGTAYRHKEHPKVKYGEYNLFGIGPGIMKYVESEGIPINGMPETDYGFLFAEDGTPLDGEVADKITVTLTYDRFKKDTTMVYDPNTGKYVFHQYGKMMVDMLTEEPEAFENVIVMHTQISKNGPFHVADFVAGGTGYYACNGQIIPIFWTCDGEDQPFRFFTNDGEPLEMGMGKSYIAICSPDSNVVWEAVELPPETEPVETELEVTVEETEEETTGETVEETE